MSGNTTISIFLNYNGPLSKFSFSCVFNDTLATVQAATYHAPSRAIQCIPPKKYINNQLSNSNVLLIQLIEASDPDHPLPLEPMYHTYIADNDPLIIEYFSRPVYPSAIDLRYCSTCAVYRPDTCFVPADHSIDIPALCNTPTSSGVNTPNPIIVVPNQDIYQPKDRINNTIIKDFYCVFHNELNEMYWQLAVYDSVAGWFICLPPANLPIDSMYTISLAENNNILPITSIFSHHFVSDADASTSYAQTSFLLNATQFITQTYTINAPRYQQLQLKELCETCSTRNTNSSIFNSFLASDICLSSQLLQTLPFNQSTISFCNTPKIGSDDGSTDIQLIPFNYSIVDRASLFTLSCAFSTFTTLVVNITVNSTINITQQSEVNGINITTFTMENITTTYTQTQYIPTFTIYTSAPIQFFNSQPQLFCTPPSIADFQLLSNYSQNVSSSQILISLVENDYLLPDIYPPLLHTYSQQANLSVPIDIYGTNISLTRNTQQYCLDCANYFPDIDNSSTALFNTLLLNTSTNSTMSLMYCLNEPNIEICNSPKFGSVVGDTNIQIFITNTYMAEWRMRVFNIYCVFQHYHQLLPIGLPLFQPTTYNSTLSSFLCVPPPSTVGSQLTITLSENNRILPFITPVWHTYINQTDPILLQWQAEQNTSITPKRFCQDCHNTSVYVESLSVPLDTSVCYVDCHGDWNGAAEYDSCHICSDGLTQHVPDSDQDCQGLCFGPFRIYQHRCTCFNNTACFNITLPSQIGYRMNQSAMQYITHIYEMMDYNDSMSAHLNTSVDDVDPNYYADPSTFTLFNSSLWSQTTQNGRSVTPNFVLYSLPFIFPYYESNYTAIYLNSQGLIYLNPTLQQKCRQANADRNVAFLFAMQNNNG